MLAQAVVVDEDRVLLAVRSDLWGWELPGGTVEAGETPEEALCREVREETGLVVAVDRHVGDYHRSGFRPHLARVYACHPVGGRLRAGDESREVGWFPADAPPDTLFPWYRAPLVHARSAGAPVDCREHQGLGDIAAGMRIDLAMRLGRR